MEVRMTAEPARCAPLAILILAISMVVSTVAICPADDNGFQKVNHMIDFSDYAEGSVQTWLEEKGFTFQRDARNRKKLDLDVSEDALQLQAKAKMIGLILNEGVDLEEFSSIRIEWGVNQYPEGASYERKLNNEALAVMVFFGYDKISSGHFAIPNSPYFLSLFLGQEEKINKAYKGNYFKKSGRFICLGNPKPGETLVSTLDLVSTFKKYFEKDEVPLISGIALTVDTSKSGDNGQAAAYIKRVEFLE